MVIISPLYKDSKLDVVAPVISCSKLGWRINAKIPASKVDKNKVMMEGTFRAIKIPVATGTISNQGVIRNFSFKAAATSGIC